MRRTDAYFSNGGGDGSARHSTEKPAYGCLFLGKQNRISQQTRVQLNQFTKLTYGPAIQQQLHMPKREGRGVPGGRQLVATPGYAHLRGHPGRFNFPEPHWPYLNTEGCCKEDLISYKQRTWPAALVSVFTIKENQREMGSLS